MGLCHPGSPVLLHRPLFTIRLLRHGCCDSAPRFARVVGRQNVLVLAASRPLFYWRIKVPGIYRVIVPSCLTSCSTSSSNNGTAPIGRLGEHSPAPAARHWLRPAVLTAMYPDHAASSFSLTTSGALAWLPTESDSRSLIACGGVVCGTSPCWSVAGPPPDALLPAQGLTED